MRLTAHASNPGAQPRTVTLRWQLIDYEGEMPVAEAVERQVTIPPGKMVSETVPVKLVATGCVLARVSAVADGKELDRSDLPLTSLPYRMGPRRPEPVVRPTLPHPMFCHNPDRKRSVPVRPHA